MCHGYAAGNNGVKWIFPLIQVKHFFKANEPRAQARLMLLSIAFQLAQVLPGLAEVMIEAIRRIQQLDDDPLAMDPGTLFDRCIV